MCLFWNLMRAKFEVFFIYSVNTLRSQSHICMVKAHFQVWITGVKLKHDLSGSLRVLHDLSGSFTKRSRVVSYIFSRFEHDDSLQMQKVFVHCFSRLHRTKLPEITSHTTFLSKDLPQSSKQHFIVGCETSLREHATDKRFEIWLRKITHFILSAIEYTLVWNIQSISMTCLDWETSQYQNCLAQVQSYRSPNSRLKARLTSKFSGMLVCTSSSSPLLWPGTPQSLGSGPRRVGRPGKPSCQRHPW